MTYDEATGLCTTCYSGYEVSSDGGCRKSDAPSGDPNCKTFKNGVCTECSKGAIFNSFRVCIVIDPSCKTYSESDGGCTTCYPGYRVSGTICVKEDKGVSDPNCA